MAATRTPEGTGSPYRDTSLDAARGRLAAELDGVRLAHLRRQAGVERVLLPPSVLAAARRLDADPGFRRRVAEVSAHTSLDRLHVAHVLAVDDVVREVLP